MPSSDSGMFVGSDVIPQPEPKPASESFGGFFETWLQQQNHDLDALTAAVKANAESTQSHAESARSLSQLVGQVIGHYEYYYRVKSESVSQDAVRMMTPAWRSHLEDTFLWVGGWRPTMAFHLLYSISGLQLEAGLSELMKGFSTGDLADLSPSQLGRVDELHRYTVKEEKALTELLAAHQETVADSSMVELAQLATELTRTPNPVAPTEVVGERVEEALAGKEDKLVGILRNADGLRLRTLKEVVALLSPAQSAHFLIAAAELHLRVHEWGMKKDGQVDGSGPGPSP